MSLGRRVRFRPSLRLPRVTRMWGLPRVRLAAADILCSNSCILKSRSPCVSKRNAGIVQELMSVETLENCFETLLPR